MKQTIKAFFLFSYIAFTLTSCDKKLDELAPHNVNFENQQFSTKNGYLKATIGNYALFTSGTELGFSNNMDYVWLNLAEFRGNNIKVIDIASTVELMNYKETDAFTFSNSAQKDYGYAYWYWRAAYKNLLSINLVLKNIKAGETDADILNAKGENLFLRAVLFFDMVR